MLVRPSVNDHSRLSFGDLELIPDEGKVLRDGTEVHLTKTEFRLLCELAESPGKVLSREALLDKVWGYDYFGDGRLVDVHVRLAQPVHSGHEPGKGLGLSTLLNIGDAVVAEGLASAEDLAQTSAAFAAFVADARSLISLPRVFQVWGHK